MLRKSVVLVVLVIGVIVGGIVFYRQANREVDYDVQYFTERTSGHVQYLSAGLTPDHPVYFLDLAVDALRLKLGSRRDPLVRETWLLGMAEEKLVELTNIASGAQQRSIWANWYVDTTLERWQRYIAQAHELVPNMLPMEYVPDELEQVNRMYESLNRQRQYMEDHPRIRQFEVIASMIDTLSQRYQQGLGHIQDPAYTGGAYYVLDAVTDSTAADVLQVGGSEDTTDTSESGAIPAR